MALASLHCATNRKGALDLLLVWMVSSGSWQRLNPNCISGGGWDSFFERISGECPHQAHSPRSKSWSRGRRSLGSGWVKIKMEGKGVPGQERREPLTASVGAEANLTPTFQKELKLVVHHNVRIHTFSLHEKCS